MPTSSVLVLNSGSSSIKFSVFETMGDNRRKLQEGAVDGIGTHEGEFWIRDAAGNKVVDRKQSIPALADAFKLIAEALRNADFGSPSAIGHRMVSGGPTVLENQLITPELIDEMERYVEFAPLHTPTAVFIMRESLRLFPGVPGFVCLDTWFHRTMPEVATHLAIPEEYSAMGVRRYGAHGLSCESIVHQLQPTVPGRLIVAHLGNGASITAIRDGKSIDTSMGLTPAGGIVSGTRTGDIDPGALIFILRKIAEKIGNASQAADQLENSVNKKSGLLGMSGLSNDMRELREAIVQGNSKARFAVDKFTSTISKWIGGYFAALDGLDLLVFTGGIGENDSASRAEICAGLSAIGIVLDPAHNQSHRADIISAANSRITVRVLPAEEDLMIVNHVMRLMAH